MEVFSLQSGNIIVLKHEIRIKFKLFAHWKQIFISLLFTTENEIYMRYPVFVFALKVTLII